MEYRGPGRRPLAVALSLILVLSLFGIGTSAATSHTSAVTHASGNQLAMTASSGFAFDPNLVSNVGTGINITVTFTDGDVQAHTLLISSREGWVIPNTYSEDQLNNFIKAYPPLFYIPAANPGTYVGNFTSPPTGWYEFICNETGHFQEGMYGFIAFGEALPSNLTISLANDGPGAAVFIIVGTIVALTMIAIVLGFVVGRRRGGIHEMPPERLGYPEPRAPAEPAPPPGTPPKSH
jgi:plastocyanin